MNRIYTIGELAELAGVSTKTLRVYERKGLLLPERNAENQYRIYTETAVRKLEQIQLMKYLGFSLEPPLPLLSFILSTNYVLQENYTQYIEYYQEVEYGKIFSVIKMISYKPFYNTLFKKGITEYQLIFKQGFSANTLHRIKKGEAISTKTLDAICYALDCEVSDVIEFVKEQHPYCLMNLSVGCCFIFKSNM